LTIGSGGEVPGKRKLVIRGQQQQQQQHDDDGNITAFMSYLPYNKLQ
jgi:hypothetical protein